MKMYELIKRLENIRDKMESTFSNEFQRGELDNLIEELIKMTPEVGEEKALPSLGTQPRPTWYPPSTSPFIYYPTTTTTGGIINTSNGTSIVLDASNKDSINYNYCSGITDIGTFVPQFV